MCPAEITASGRRRISLDGVRYSTKYETNRRAGKKTDPHDDHSERAGFVCAAVFLTRQLSRPASGDRQTQSHLATICQCFIASCCDCYCASSYRHRPHAPLPRKDAAKASVKVGFLLHGSLNGVLHCIGGTLIAIWNPVE